VLKLPNIPGGPYGKVFPLAVLTLLYFAYTRGWKSSVFLTIFLFIYCWSVEELSVHTGFPYGHYYYSDMLGVKLDVVPITMGLMYFWIYIFPSYFIASLIADGKLFGISKNSGRLLYKALIAAILVAGIDMALDPMDATKLGLWVWTNNIHTGYYGIPYHNYLGYLITMIPAFFIYGLVEKSFGAKPIGPVNIWIGSLPLIFSLITFLMYSVPAPGGVFLVACFSMFFPLILATDRLRQYFSEQ
jgi:uncharacterized membrane protein